MSSDSYSDDVSTAADSDLLLHGRGRFRFGSGEKDLIATSIAEVPATGIAAEAGIARTESESFYLVLLQTQKTC